MNRILIGVLSAWQYPKRRERCLRTWMADLPKHPEADAVFLFGVPQLLRAERQGRCLFLPCPNAYQFLPQRTHAFCKWAIEQPGWDFLFKTDDDTRLSLPRLTAYDLRGADYVGTEWKPGVGYASGGGYFLSRRAATIVAESMLDWQRPGCFPRPTAPYEDLLVGKVLREAGIPLRTETERFKFFASVNDRPGPQNNWVYCTPGVREPE